MIDNPVSRSTEDFELLTLSAQLDHLTKALESESAVDLIRMCAPNRDPAPLAWLSRKLLERGWFSDEGNRTWFADFVVGLPETTVDKLLKALVQNPLSAPQKSAFGQLLLGALQVVPLKALSSMCLLDRMMKHHFPDERDRHLNEIYSEVETFINGATPDAIPLKLLAQLPAVSVIRLEELAHQKGCLAALQAVKRNLADEAIEILGNAPKAVSQANAEDLLARRVYTDPGHFLIELLQNAEDSGAKTWKVIFDQDKLIVWHDGTPFDTRDLVGITSIGQTTKRKQQIGFFGVGFKSVYEVTERPQIYSDVYCFEIADVSIPKLLANRPSGIPADGTAVVLPLRQNLDDERSPAALYEKGAALDACVLLTLRSIDVIDFELTQAAGGPKQHKLIEQVTETETSIRHEPSGDLVSYSIQDDEYSDSGAAREAGRPDRTKVMVGMLLDDKRIPIPLPPGSAEVYSYLPTREQPGLRFFVQGHFDVPVDRERIAPDSAWNRWILSQVPAQLARMARRVQDEKNLEIAVGFLNVLPLKNELPNAPFAAIPGIMPDVLGKISFVPSTKGMLISPAETIVASPAIVQLFENDPIDDSRSFLAPALNSRSQELLLELGAKSFDTQALLAYLEERLQDGQDSSLSFLKNKAKLERLYDLFLTELESLERKNATVELADWIERLKALPVMPDSNGKLRRPKELSRGSLPVRRIYAESRSFISETFEESGPRTIAFFDRLEIAKLDLEYLVSDLEQNIGHNQSPLALPRDSFPTNEKCVELILVALIAADWNLLKRAARLPLFRANDGQFYPIATDSSDLDGVLDGSGSPLAEDLSAFYKTARPISSSGALHAPAQVATKELLHRLGAPALTLAVLADDLGRRMFSRESDTLHELHALLEKHVDEISDKVSRALVQLPIWLDQKGNAFALTGDNKVFIAHDEEIPVIFSQAPFLDRTIAARRHTSNMNIAPVSVPQVIDGLVPESEPPLVVANTPEAVNAALGYILDNSEKVDSTGIRTLKEKAMFLSDASSVLPLSQLSKAESGELRALYRSNVLRNFIDESGTSWRLVKELGMENSVISASPETLAYDLETDLEFDSRELTHPEQGYKPLLSYVSKRVDKMTKPLLLRFTAMNIYPDTTGNTGILPIEKTDRSANYVFPSVGVMRRILTATGVRLLNDEIQGIIRPLMLAAKVQEASLELLVDWLSNNAISDEETLDQIQDLFLTRKFELTELYPPGDRVSKPNQTLNKLRIWKTLGDNVVGADEIMGGNLADIFEKGTSEFSELQKACLKPAALKRLQGLAPLMIPISSETFLADLIKKSAKPDQPLSEQPYFLSSVKRVTRLYEIVGNRNKIDLPSVDAAGNLTFAKLHYTDADTMALLSGLPTTKEILHPELTAYFELGKEEPSKMGNIRSQVAKLWSKMISTRGFDDFEPLPPLMVIGALPKDMDGNRRGRFYRWLIMNKAAVFDDRQTIAKLQDAPLFLTRQGSMVKPGDLIFDEDMPDLGIDWLPSKEIPSQLIDILSIHLDVGRPNLDDMIKRHVVPAYEAATERNDQMQAGRLLLWLARRLSNRSPADIQRLLKGKNLAIIKIEDMSGKFYFPQELVLPDLEIRTHVTKLWKHLGQPSDTQYPKEIHPFLIALGVATAPPFDMIAERLGAVKDKDDSNALVHLIAHLRQKHGETIYKQLPGLRSTAWLLDGVGKLKPPGQLYLRSYEIESLIGPFADIYLDKQQEEILGPMLCKGLTFKESADIKALDIMHHVAFRAERKEAVSPRVYSWLDLAAGRGELGAQEFDNYFGDKPWILTDDDEYESHKKVLGTRAFHLFGNLRGYWTRGWKQYPDLCRTLGIREGTTPHSVHAFIEEVGAEVARDGSKNILKKEPALPLMLVSCFAVIGKKGMKIRRDLPVIPATHKQATELLPAGSPNLYWSDTPTLETLFSGVGKLFLAKRGTADDTEAVDAFYTSIGINRLRDTYKIVAARKEGGDRSKEMAQPILSLRGVLRALAAVVPRIELERELNSETVWVYAKHLRSLSASGSIRAIENLKVRYVLPGVGETEVERPAAYETDRGELLVDTKVLTDPELTGLSEGLLPAIIEGPSAESFIDLFEILLARRSQDEMQAYLNRRHFAEANVALSTVDRIAHRIGELLDYGLADKLSKRFKTLSRRDLSKWRGPSLIKQIETSATTDFEKSSADAVKIMLKAIDIQDENAELETLLQKLLLAATISDCSELLVAEKIADKTDVSDLTEDDKNRRDKEVVVSPAASAASSTSSPAAQKVVPPPAIINKIQDSGMKRFLDQFLFGKQPENERKSPGLSRENEGTKPIKVEEPKRDTVKPSELEKEGDSELPSWLLGNYFAPSKQIPSQIWHFSKNCKTLESMKKDVYMQFSPGRLPSPYLYSVNKIGASFNSVLQTWTFGKSAQKYFLTPGTPSGKIVSFAGKLYAGKSRIPLPLYGRLADSVTATNGTIKSIIHDEVGVIVDLAGEGLIDIQYDVEILAVPQMESRIGFEPVNAGDRALISPTVPLASLPMEVVKFLNETSNSSMSDSKRALAVQEFIRSNYIYDAEFLDRPEVIKRRATLSFLTGNHHLELLHASRDGNVLGRGVCYELNVLLVELLRHLRIPSCIAVGWVLDEGVVDLSDHLFALALVSSLDGPCILPLDAAATDRGPIRTVQRRQFPQPAKELKAQPAVPTVKGSWDITPRKTAGAEGGGLPPGWDVKPKARDLGTPKPKEEKGFFQKLFAPEDPPSDVRPDAVAKNVYDSKMAEEWRMRKAIEETLEEERSLRQKAEAKLGEERRLRKQAEEQLGKFENPEKTLDEETLEAARKEKDRLAREAEFRITEPKRQAEEFQLLCKAYDSVLLAMGLDKSNYPIGTEGLRQKLIKLLGSTSVMEAYITILRNGGDEAAKLTDELKHLEDLRLIEIETVPTLKIHVVENPEED